MEAPRLSGSRIHETTEPPALISTLLIDLQETGRALTCPGREESGIILHHAHQRGNNAPNQRQRWEPDSRRGPLEDNIRRHFKSNVSDEVQRQTGQVHVARYATRPSVPHLEQAGTENNLLIPMSVAMPSKRALPTTT